MGLLSKYFKMQMKLYLYCITFAESEILHFFSFIHTLEDILTKITNKQGQKVVHKNIS